jgi:hypothetical protein
MRRPAPDGRLVQIKTTQRKSVGISEKPDCLIVLHVDERGRFEIVANDDELENCFLLMFTSQKARYIFSQLRKGWAWHKGGSDAERARTGAAVLRPRPHASFHK